MLNNISNQICFYLYPCRLVDVYCCHTYLLIKVVLACDLKMSENFTEGNKEILTTSWCLILNRAKRESWIIVGIGRIFPSQTCSKYHVPPLPTGLATACVSGVVGSVVPADTYQENLFAASNDGFLCLVCNKEMRRKDHMRNHAQGQEVSCYQCGRVYKNARSLEVHISAHHRFKMAADL